MDHDTEVPAADASTVLNAVLELLSTFSKTHTRGCFASLLGRLQTEVEELRKETSQQEEQKQRPKKHTDTATFSLRLRDPGPSHVSTRAQTRVAKAQAKSTPLQDTCEDASKTTYHETGSETEPLLEQQSYALAAAPSVLSKRRGSILSCAEDASAHRDVAAEHNVAVTSIEEMDGANASGATANAVGPDITGINIVGPDTTSEMLRRQIQDCKTLFRGQTFIVTGDGHSETVNPDEIDAFFSRFGENVWLSNHNLMPLIFSFDWPSTTLLLHSSYAKLSGNLKGSTKQWPLRDSQDRIILPYCSGAHWTLFDVDLTQRLVRQYNSLRGGLSMPMIAIIQKRVASARKGWEEMSLRAELGASQKQVNDDDCGIFMTYNADCLASGRDTLEEPVDGVSLRYRYLKRLLELESRGRVERQILKMVLPPEKPMRIKRRRTSPEASSPCQDQTDQKKIHLVAWAPPPHLGHEAAWFEERDLLAAMARTCEPQESELSSRERAEELLCMIEAIGCQEVMAAWNDAVSQWKREAQSERQTGKSMAKTICFLAGQTECRSFRDKALLRVAKWIFALKILQDIERFRQQGAPSRQFRTVTDAGRGGNAVTRALLAFMEEVNPKSSMPEPMKEGRQEYQKYKDWWKEGQLWVALSNVMGAGILLLIPGDLCIRDGTRVSNKQYTKIRVAERQPFAQALRRLRPDLKDVVSELEGQLEVLNDDISHLLGRLKSTKVPQQLDA